MSTWVLLREKEQPKRILWLSTTGPDRVLESWMKTEAAKIRAQVERALCDLGPVPSVRLSSLLSTSS